MDSSSARRSRGGGRDPEFLPLESPMKTKRFVRAAMPPRLGAGPAAAPFGRPAGRMTR